MQTISKNELPAIRSPFQGGFYMGLIQDNGELFAIIRAPKAEGFHTENSWGEAGSLIDGAGSFADGMANTRAMAEAGSQLGTWALSLNIAGFTDWYLPARDELELAYRAFKPSAEENWCSFRDGDNPSSLPAGYPYTTSNPAQAPDTEFQEGGSEALEPTSYWSSTQLGPYDAWIQLFDGGYQGSGHKDDARPAFAVRRIKVTP